MSFPEHDGCITVTDGQRCNKATTAGLPICGDCLDLLLSEVDPRRRRALAALDKLPAGVVRRLVDDPDDQVRAQVASRDDLDTGTVARFADADREPAPVVWRSLAATPHGARHAVALSGTDDPLTLAILAANPSVDRELIQRLADHPDPDVAATARASLAGEQPPPGVAMRIRDARHYEVRPIATPPAVPNGPVGGAADPDDAPPDDAPPKRRGAWLLGAAAVVVLAVVITLVITYAGGRGTTARTVRLTATSLDPTTTGADTSATSAPTTNPAPTTKPPTTAPATLPPATAPKATVPPVTAPPATPGPLQNPAPAAGPVEQHFSITPTTGRFCDSVRVTVDFSPEPAYVTITDDTGAQIGGWAGASGQTHAITLTRPTSILNVTVAASGTGLNATGSADGTSC